GSKEVINYEYQAHIVSKLIDSADWIFCIDFNDINRVGDITPLLEKAIAPKINIDHHQEPKHFCEYEYIETDASSTAQLIYEFIAQTPYKNLLNKSIANALYVGIMTDTGSFRFPSTTASTHHVIAELIETGIDNAAIHRNIYDSSSESRLRLLGYSISDKMQLFLDHGFSIIGLSEEELQRFNYQKGDTEGIVNFPLSIQEVKVSVFLSAKDDKVKMSFRSKGDIAINKIANDYFNGGGHTNAAGGISSESLLETIEKLIVILKEELPNSNGRSDD
ncbi:DHHA1 domain-containing protein, partial [Vicingaceae bacterium]|nr:DHHA1 domain-containing protein [Vicingaceae bacterium]